MLYLDGNIHRAGFHTHNSLAHVALTLPLDRFTVPSIPEMPEIGAI